MYLVAAVGVDESLMHRSTALNDECLHIVLIQLGKQLGNGLLAMQHQSAWAFTPPMARVQCRMFAFVGGFAHQNGVALCPELMRQHLGEGRRDGQGAVMVVDEAVGRLRPLHDHVRTLFALEHDKMAIQCQAFFFKHSHNHLDARPAPVS